MNHTLHPGGYINAKPGDNKHRVDFYVFLRKLGLSSCQWRVFLADDGSFYCIFSGGLPHEP